MTVLKQISDNTRIVYKRFSFRYLDSVILLQRKGKRFWNTVAWTYPCVFKGQSATAIELYLLATAKDKQEDSFAETLRKFGK